MSSEGRSTAPTVNEGGAPPVPYNVYAQAAAAVEGNSGSEGNIAEREGDPPPPSDAPPLDPANVPPPAYGDAFHEIVESNSAIGVDTKLRVGNDGRVDININQRTRRLSTLFAPAIQSQVEADIQAQEPLPPPYIPPSLGGEPGKPPPPPLHVVIHVVGSRGDVQPFVALGKVLKETYGHRVRLATHPTFRDFVLENGLEFFSIGGDPAELMAFMVKNPGLMPGFDTLRSGDVGKRRKEIGTMIKGCWRSCIETGDGTGVAVTDDTVEEWMSVLSGTDGRRFDLDHLQRPFVADAIIANPPSFAHIHCAEKLGCPLHIMFTMPYSPTHAFPHPLANIQSSNADPSITNFMSYGMVDMMTWQGLGDIVNRFRQNHLGLEPISLIWAPNMLSRLRIPHTYCWSPALIPKPKDWGNYISISGFYFLALASNYTPEPELQRFLDSGPPPVYIGFGSIVVDDPNAMTKMIFDAVRKTGQRALVSKGWGGIGADELGIPDGVMMLGNVPHDWLFKHVSCVVHHGGAGTTAAGIAAGKPTVIVPFFGDQPFWGAMTAKAGAGPAPIAYKDLDAEKLAASINYAIKPECQEKAKELASSIAAEHGCQSGAQSFHQQMDVDTMRCSLSPSRAAAWRLKRTQVRLSAVAATVLGNAGLLDFKDLKLFRHQEYETETGPPDPITGATGALVGTAGSVLMGVADFPVEALKLLHIHPDASKKGKSKAKDTKSTTGSSSPSGQLTPRSSFDTRTQGSSENLAISDKASLTETPATETRSLQSSESQPTSPSASSTNQSQFNLGESLARIQSPSSIGGSTQDAPSRGGSMRAALRDQLSQEFVRRTSDAQQETRSHSHSHHRRRSGSPFGKNSKDGDPVETVVGTGKGIARILDASFRSPMDFTHALAKGFHNAPKLYGDDTVRAAEPITDFRTGVKAASKGFGLGLYDGISGLVTQPISGAKKEGAAGFIKGVGKGIGGIVLKPSAAVFGVPGYMMKGVYKELQARCGNSVQNYIIAARTAQGYEDWHYSTPEERKDIIDRWTQLQKTIKKKKNPDDLLIEWGHATRAKGHTIRARNDARRLERRRKIMEHLEKTDFGSFLKKNSKSTEKIEGIPATSSTPNVDGSDQAAPDSQTLEPRTSISSSRPSTPSDVDVLTPASSIDLSHDDQLRHAATQPTPPDRSASRPQAHHSASAPSETFPQHGAHEDEELEQAIKLSLAQASTGNQEEDAALEQAIRYSVREIEAGHHAAALEHADNEDEESRAIDNAMRASLKEWDRMRVKPMEGQYAGHDGDLVASPVSGNLGSKKGWDSQESGVIKGGASATSREVNPDAETEDDDEAKLAEAIKRSLAEQHMTPSNSHDAKEMEDAIRQSLQDAEAQNKEKSEEEIVMEYVKKQSLLEEEHRRKMTGGSVKGGTGESSRA